MGVVGMTKRIRTKLFLATIVLGTAAALGACGGGKADTKADTKPAPAVTPRRQRRSRRRALGSANPPLRCR
jgi:hypothetical protein